MSLKADDKLQTLIDRPYATQADHLRAYAYLRRRHAAGTLLPVQDGTEDIIGDYVNILGIKR